MITIDGVFAAFSSASFWGRSASSRSRINRSSSAVSGCADMVVSSVRSRMLNLFSGAAGMGKSAPSQTTEAGHAIRQGARRPRSQLPAADLAREESADRHERRAGVEDPRHRSGIGQGLPGVLQTDRSRAGVAFRGESGIHVFHEAQVAAPATLGFTEKM